MGSATWQLVPEHAAPGWQAPVVLHAQTDIGAPSCMQVHGVETPFASVHEQVVPSGTLHVELHVADGGHAPVHIALQT